MAPEVAGNNPGGFALIQHGRTGGFIATSHVIGVLCQQQATVMVWSTDRYAKMPSQSDFATQTIIDRVSPNVDRLSRLKKSFLFLEKVTHMADRVTPRFGPIGHAWAFTGPTRTESNIYNRIYLLRHVTRPRYVPITRDMKHD